MKAKKYLIVPLIFLLTVIFISCTKDSVSPEDITEQKATDYSIAGHWLNIPASTDKNVDVFYLYPTAWARTDTSKPYICEVDNPMMLKYSNLAFARQATAFETIGNVYAPYFRQVDAAYCFSLSVAEQEKLVAGIPTLDATAAFDYYIKNYNNGRPFILAGHSQGSNVLLYLLSGYMKEHPDVYSRMIAAYVIGYSVTQKFLANNTHLKFAEGADDTGVIISFNTQSPDVQAGANVLVLDGALVINPITWTRDETLVTADKNLGSLILNPDGSIAQGIPEPVMNYADAQVDKVKGAVICSTADVDKLAPGNAVLVKGVFHSFDYPFYYYNIRENAENRTKKFLGK
ncbi:MAG: DUF3089 domain-containing protein [Ignavibacteriales bacterium]|nr:MAG: DUF3089 domain-containing protein [Ignavibacteriales bacterium]